MLIKSETENPKHDQQSKRTNQKEQDPQDNAKSEQKEGVTLLQTSAKDQCEQDKSAPVPDEPPIPQDGGSNNLPTENAPETTTQDGSNVNLIQHVEEEDDSEDERLV